MALTTSLRSPPRPAESWRSGRRRQSGRAALSPDDRCLAYTSVQSGRPEAVVTTFPSLGQRWRLTTEGGFALSWSTDGCEILVATPSGHLVAHPVSTRGGFAARLPAIVVATESTRFHRELPRRRAMPLRPRAMAGS